MQNAKDTFYEVMRERLAAVNPDRTVVVRGSTRPAVLVEENELSEIRMPKECFVLRWKSLAVDLQGAETRCALLCEITYSSSGSKEQAGTDRGRVMAAMDSELLAMLAWPAKSVKTNYAGLAYGRGATAMTTNLWWGAVKLGELQVDLETLTRTARVEVMAFQEAGER